MWARGTVSDLGLTISFFEIINDCLPLERALVGSILGSDRV